MTVNVKTNITIITN